MRMKMYCLLFFSTILFNFGCTEPYEIETVDYESVLVVESTITDETKQQIVKLSRTSTLETPGISTENNANVTVTGSNGESYGFSQDGETGEYVSDQVFSASPNVQYTLHITAQDGKTYSSSAVSLPPVVEMDAVYAERIQDATQEKDGVQVLVDTEDPTGNAQYFRYEYEETYKVVAPYPSPYTFDISNFDSNGYTFDVTVLPREPERICYSKEESLGVIQTTTSNLVENKVFRFPVRYLSKRDPKILSRYSILVKQYIQSVEAFTFYKAIKKIGDIESLLSQSQPGYVKGNIFLESDPNVKVLGFFEASSVSSKRIYFNYEMFGLEKPPYFVECELIYLDYRDNTKLDGDLNEREVLFTHLSYFNYQIVFYGQPYLFNIAKAECSVCTSFSSNVRPDFWED